MVSAATDIRSGNRSAPRQSEYGLATGVFVSRLGLPEVSGDYVIAVIDFQRLMLKVV
jgi:hypothetical protein